MCLVIFQKKLNINKSAVNMVKDVLDAKSEQATGPTFSKMSTF